MQHTALDVIVVGAGHAGLSASYYLKSYGLRHLIFEQGRIAETWRSQRWDSFRLNTANKLSVFPGIDYSGTDPDGFCTSDAFAALLENYADTFQLPVVENAKVLSIEKPDKTDVFKATVLQDGRIETYYSRQVIVASGIANKGKLPVFAQNIPAHIKQLHTCDYRNAAQLPQGAVLVVGSGQSGCQIAEDLIDAGRKTFLSTSMVARIPRRYRGKDIVDWLLQIKFMDVPTEEVTDPKILAMKVPQISGTAGGHTVSLQYLAAKGAVLLGKLEQATDEHLYFQPNTAQHVKFADEFSKKVKDTIDEFIVKNNITAPPPEVDLADIPDTDAACASTIASVNVAEHAISAIVWATGFCGDFSYLKFPVLDSNGNPVHHQGIVDVSGLYFLGFPWLRTRKSAVINGITADAAFITDKVYNYAGKQVPLEPVAG